VAFDEPPVTAAHGEEGQGEEAARRRLVAGESPCQAPGCKQPSEAARPQLNWQSGRALHGLPGAFRGNDSLTRQHDRRTTMSDPNPEQPEPMAPRPIDPIDPGPVPPTPIIPDPTAPDPLNSPAVEDSTD
jgi:hypothetical protein